MDFARSLISNCLLILTLLVGLSTPTFDYSASSYTPRVRCSRVCACYYQSLFCRGYKYYNIPSDTSETIQNIDFTVSTNNIVLLQVSPWSRSHHSLYQQVSCGWSVVAAIWCIFIGNAIYGQANFYQVA